MGFSTLLFTVALVIFVTYLFLGNIRATLVPTIAVPVSIIGTLAVLYALGMTINTVTLFALILAISVVVDDAIIVVENVERLMDEDGLAPRAATFQAMKEVAAPIVATSLVLVAVFGPTDPACWAAQGPRVAVIWDGGVWPGPEKIIDEIKGMARLIELF